jgi:hypothetical protein
MRAKWTGGTLSPICLNSSYLIGGQQSFGVRPAIIPDLSHGHVAKAWWNRGQSLEVYARLECLENGKKEKCSLFYNIFRVLTKSFGSQQIISIQKLTNLFVGLWRPKHKSQIYYGPSSFQESKTYFLLPHLHGLSRIERRRGLRL